jgi:hypothetical protein
MPALVAVVPLVKLPHARLKHLVAHCQLKRSWYASRVGGAAARVGELLCSPIALARLSRAGPGKGALGPLS